jgi:hypothetical protein
MAIGIEHIPNSVAGSRILEAFAVSVTGSSRRSAGTGVMDAISCRSICAE